MFSVLGDYEKMIGDMTVIVQVNVNNDIDARKVAVIQKCVN